MTSASITKAIHTLFEQVNTISLNFQVILQMFLPLFHLISVGPILRHIVVGFEFGAARCSGDGTLQKICWLRYIAAWSCGIEALVDVGVDDLVF